MLYESGFLQVFFHVVLLEILNGRYGYLLFCIWKKLRLREDKYFLKVQNQIESQIQWV